MRVDLKFPEGGGFNPQSNKRVNPGSVMGIGNVVTGGTFDAPPVASPNPRPICGAHLEGEVTPGKSADTPRNGDPPQSQVTPQEMRAVQAMVHSFSSPPASTEKVGAQEPGPKRQKTPS